MMNVGVVVGEFAIITSNRAGKEGKVIAIEQSWMILKH